jgi:Fic family protein
MRKLTAKYLDAYLSDLTVDIDKYFAEVQEKDWTIETFKFHTAVSVMSSARIEGETLEIDSYLKHKLQNIEYLPNLTEKPNDLYEAYEFARDNQLNLSNFLNAHRISTQHLLPQNQRGVVRTGNMIILDNRTGNIQYEATLSYLVAKEFESFWEELEGLIHQKLTTQEIFYYASLIHLVFVKIHPFNDGNGRTARLLEKWFLATFLGEKAWFIGSEHYYYKNLEAYYQNLARVGLFYDDLDYQKSVPFLLMLSNSLV